MPESVGFSIASAALDQLTRSLAVAYAPHDIRVNAVALGSIMSGSLQAQIAGDEDLHDEIVNATPIGRIGGADEAPLSSRLGLRYTLCYELLATATF